MEKENFYSILDEMSTYNFKTYFENSEWYKESLASQVESDTPQQSGNQGNLREDIISHMDDLHKRKLKLFEKKFKSYQELESKEPRLILEKSPEELPNLLKEIKSMKFQEIFYQPFNPKFLDKLEIFIKNKICEEETTDINKENKEEKNKDKDKDNEVPLWITALNIYYILHIYNGNYKKISEFHSYMKNDPEKQNIFNRK